MADIDIDRRSLLLTGAAALGSAALLGGCGNSGPIGGAEASAPSATSGDYQADVVIVGGGVAGLTAARRLVAAGVRVLVAEARGRVGGRTLNYALSPPAHSDTIVEVGGQWVGPTQDRVLALIDELGLSTFPTYNDGSLIDYRNGRAVSYDGRVPPTDPIGAAEAGLTIERLNALAEQVPLDAPWTAENAEEWDSQTFQTWMDQNLITPGGKSLVQLAIEAVFSAQPRDLSLLHVLFYIHSAGSLDALIDTAGGAQESRVVGGTQLIAQRMAADLGERVLLNAPVSEIEQGDGTVVVRGNSFSIKAQRAIVTLPPTLAARIRYMPALTGLRDQLTQRMPMGTVIKVQCVYPTPFWRMDGLSGQATSDTGPVKLTYDNSPPDGHVGVMMGFIEGEEGRAAMRMTPEQRRAGVIESFVRYFGEGAAEPLDYIEQNWASEEWTRGCYAGYMPPGVWLDYGDQLSMPAGLLHWAGTETASIWNGYIDGAVRSGEQAAAQVQALL
ncbi:MAG: flavin monoamine oxidase family protein [Pseudomonadota bacterium]|nr:flavin monoamine oxidase family protein [Pseudomonadota bacterium]